MTKNTFGDSPFDQFSDEPIAAKPVQPKIEAPTIRQKPVAAPDFDALFDRYGKEYGVPPALLRTIAQKESSLNPNAVGATNENGTTDYGLMQHNSRYHKERGITNWRDPEQSVKAAAALLKSNFDTSSGDWRQAVRRYNGSGPRAEAYADDVMAKFTGKARSAKPASIDDQFSDEPIQPNARAFTADDFSDDPIEINQPLLALTPEQQRAIDEKPLLGYLKDKGVEGFGNMEQSLNVARWAVAGGDPADIAEQLAKQFASQAQAAKSTGEKQIDAAFKEVTDAKGVVDTTIKGGKAIYTAITNPKALAGEVVGQASNSLPTIGAGAVGAGTGAGVGALAGAVPGAIAGAVIGGRTGMAAGTTATELGGEVTDMIGKRLAESKQPPTAQNILAILSDKQFQNDALKQGLQKGLTVAAIDQVFMGIGGKVATAPVRKAATKQLAEQGIDVSTAAARKAALASPAGRAAVEAAKPTVAARVGAGVAATGVDSAGEVIGEGVSQQVARGEVDYGDALREGVASLGQSVVEPAIGGAMDSAKAAADAARATVRPVPNTPSASSGPLQRATENAAAQPDRVTATAPDGSKVTGTVTGTSEDGKVQIVDDNGEIVTFQTGPNGVKIEPAAPIAPLSNAVEAAAGNTAPEVEADPRAQRFTELARATSAAEKQSDPATWTPEERAAYESGNYEEFSRLRGYTPEEIAQYREYTNLADELIKEYGVDAVQSLDVQATEPNHPQAPVEPAQAATETVALGEPAVVGTGDSKRTITYRLRKDGRIERTIQYPGQAPEVDFQINDRDGFDNGWVSAENYGSGEHYPGQFQPDAALAHVKNDLESMGYKPEQPKAPEAPKLSEMDEPALRTRLKYLADQAKNNGGWDKMLVAERRKVEREINARVKASQPALDLKPETQQPKGTLNAQTTEAQQATTEQPAKAAEVAVSKPDVPEANFGKTNGFKIGQRVHVTHGLYEGTTAVVESFRKDGQVVLRGENEGKTGYSVEPDRLADGQYIAKPSDEVPAASPTKRLTKDQSDSLFGVDAKRAKAIDRIAAGKAWFNDGVKAKDFIAKNGLKDTHEVAKGKGGRFDIVAKESVPVTRQQSVETATTAAEKVLSEGGSDAQANRAATDALIDSMATTPEIEIAQDAPAAVKAAKARTAIKEKTNVNDNSPSGKPASAEEVAEKADAVSTPDATVQPEAAKEEVDPGRFERRMRAAATVEQTNSDDVQTTSLRYVPFDTALKIAREAVADGIPMNWVQFHGQLDLTADSAQRLLADVSKNAQEMNTSAEPVQKSEKTEQVDPSQFAGNKIFTQSAVDKARARLKSKLGNLNSGFDPEMAMDGLTLAGAYVESGTRTFAAYAKAMIEDIGDGVKPYLLSFYESVRHYPGVDSDGMSSPSSARAQHEALMLDHAEVEKSKVVSKLKDKENDNEPAKLDQPSPRELEGKQPDAVQGSEPQRETGRGPEGRSGADARGDDGAGGQRAQQPGSVGDDAREVPVPASGTAEGRGSKSGSEPVQRGKRAAKRDPAADRGTGNQPSLIPESGNRSQDRADGFVITEDDAIGEGGQKTKFKQNIAAIRLLKELEASGRPATRAEQAVLAKYVGWGGIPQAFYRDNNEVTKGWEKEAAELKDVMTEAELAAAAASTRNAHYTSPEVVGGLWDAVKHFGFQGGRTLEPSVGVGNFFGLMPTALRGASQLTGVELDHVTGGIAKQLYPNANIQAPLGFQDFTAPSGYFDLAIGNPPFGAEGIYDPRNRKISGFSIHNYFFAKSIDMVKPNGVLAMVVTNRLLDKVGDKERSYIAQRAEFLGAIRLPNNAFSKNAGTEVTTDIIFLRKLKDGEQPGGQKWGEVKQYKDANGKLVPLNEYFVANPDMMLGEFGMYGSMYSPEDSALVAKPGQDTAALMQAAIAKLPSNFMDAPSAAPALETIQPLHDVSQVKVGSVFEQGGQIYERREDMLGKQQAAPVTFANDKAKERVTGMIKVRDALISVRGLQLQENVSEKALDAARATLNKEYDAFVKANGPLNADANKRLMRDDPTWAQIAALEDGFDKGISATVAKATGEKARPASARKSAIFSKRTQAPYKAPESAKSAKDALVSSMAERGRVDLDYMASLYAGHTPEAIAKELDGLIYKNPAGGWESRDQYLSGNVKKKLAQAIDAAKADPSLRANVDALTAVQPADIEAVDIDVKTGAHWVPADVMQKFVETLSGGERAKALYNPVTATWTLSVERATAANLTEYSTDRVSMTNVLEAAANQKQIVVRDKHYDGTTTVNEAATTAANAKVERVKAEWKNWLWTDDARRERLARIYNDTFNTDVQREFDGSHLTFPGKVGDDIIQLRLHQANAVWRMVQSGTTLLDHVVGAGKTFTMIAGIMEMRRMGLAKKPMLAVPNHLVGQWAEDFMKLYPGANILAATKKDFEKENRKKLFARIATGDWDAVIVAHSSFGKVEVEPEFQAAFIKQQIADMDTSISAMRAAEGKGSRNVKQIEKQKANLEEKLKKLFDTGSKDDNLYFSELGVDAVLLDEAHEFKNLGFSTGMQRVAGLGNPAGSNKAADMFMKIQATLARTGGKNVVFATGTPISNTMAEMYTMQRFLDYGTLKDQGIAHFDAWAKTFGEVVTDWELSPSGQYKMNSRFAKFVNMPELMQRYSSFADVVNRDDINRMLASQGKKLPVPKIKGGKPENTVVDRSAAQAQYIGIPTVDDNGVETYPEGSLIWRSENLPKKAEKGADNMLKIMSDARKAALDMRLIDPSYPDNPASKVNVSANNIKAIYDQWTPDRGAQLVFIDLSTPKGAVAKEAAALRDLVAKAEEGDEAAQEKLDSMSPDELLALDSKFSVYDDLKAKLIARGIPENEIAFIHDANTELQKEDLFGKVRSGRVRVLFGSTAKMGAGMNVQERLVALHHLDAPWRPSDLEQREGRIIRQGNKLYDANPEGFEIQIKRYATKQTLDSRMWQTIEAKARFIEQVRKGTGAREVEDVAGEAANSAEMKAASSGNPLILEEMSLRQAIRKLENEKSEHDREQYRIKDRIRWAADYAAKSDAKAADFEADAPLAPKEFAVRIGNQTFDKHGEAGQAILDAVNAMYDAGKDSREIGSYGGFKLTVDDTSTSLIEKRAVLTIDGKGSYQIEANPGSSATGLALRLQNTVKTLQTDAEQARAAAARERAEVPKLEAKVKPWGSTKALAEAKTSHTAIIEQLRPKKKPEAEAKKEDPAAFSRTAGEDTALQELSKADDLFAMPKSTATDIEQIAKDIAGDAVKGVRTTKLGSETMYTIDFTNGATARITDRKASPYGNATQVYAMDLDANNEMYNVQKGRPGENPEDAPESDDVWIDVSTSKPGEYGPESYAIAAAYAHNTGKVFIGDPSGLSDAALRRRTEQMLSSALKYGTTDHLAPHPRQVAGSRESGVPALKWIYGDSIGNIERMIAVATRSLENAIPDISKHIKFNPATGEFTGTNGNVVYRERLRDQLKPQGADTVRSGILAKGEAGWRTLARYAIFKSILEVDAGEKSKRGSILDQLGAYASRLGASDATERVFYSRGDVQPRSAEPNVARVERLANGIAARWDNRPNIIVAEDMADTRIPAEVRAEDQKQRSLGTNGEPRGFYYKGTVYLIAGQLNTPQKIAETLFHEALGHYGLRGLYGKALQPILRQIIQAKPNEIAARKGLDAMAAAEEILADMAQTRPELGFVKRAVAAIRTWLRENVPGFKDMTLSDAEIIQNYILPARGWVERGDKTGNDTGAPVFSRAKDQTETEAFKKWFGDSKVVDADGKPLVVYHGTTKSFDAFSGGTGWFTSNAGEANFWGGVNAEGSNVVPAYLALKNPRVLQASEASRNRIIDALEALHNDEDGVLVMEDGEIRWAVASEPTQIKSATGNNGDFDGTNPDIRFSRATAVVNEGLTPPEQGMLRKVQAAIQDQHNRLKEVQDRIQKQTGVHIPEHANAYGAETNRPGKVAAQNEDLQDKMLEPMMEKLAKTGFKMDDLEQLLHAMHAPERNAQNAKINEEKDLEINPGSGMSNSKAAEIMAKYRDAKGLHEVADMARKILRGALDVQLAARSISQDDYDALIDRYKNYVPLKGNMEYGPGIRRSTGHETRDEHILENIARDYQMAVLAGEKNIARQHLLQMVLTNPDSDLWTVGVAPRGKRVVSDGYSVQTKDGKQVAYFVSKAQVEAFLEAKGPEAAKFDVMDSHGETVKEFTLALQPNEVPVFVDGTRVRMQIKDEVLASQLRPLNREQMGVILEAMRSANQYFSAIYTGKNPYFIPRNMVRDAISGTVNIVGNEGAAVMAKTWIRYPAAFKAMTQWAATKNVPDSKMGEYLAEYRANGGKTGAAWMSDLEEQGKSLERMFDDAFGVGGYVKEGRIGKASWLAAKKTVRAAGHAIEIINQGAENAMRLALFATLREQGVNPGEAARAAKAVTVNFDRKGTQTGVLGALYLFVNPAIQGTANMANTLGQGKHKKQAWAALGLLASLGAYMALSGMDDDEDEWLGRKWSERSKNINWKVGNTTIKLPMSQEFAPFFAAGMAMAEVSRGQSKMAAAGHIVSSFLDAYVPFRGLYDYDSENHAADLAMAAIPTIARAPTEMAFNRNSFGSPIVPENAFSKNRPDNLKMARGTKGSVFDSTAQGIAKVGEAMGAGRYENDISKVSPETLKYAWRTYTGGLGLVAADVVGIGSMVARDAGAMGSTDIPFIKDFVKDDTTRTLRSRFYGLSDEIHKKDAEFKEAKKAEDGEEMDRIEAVSKSTLHQLSRFSKQSADIRDQMADIMQDKTMGLKEQRAKLKELEAEEQQLYRDALEALK